MPCSFELWRSQRFASLFWIGRGVVFKLFSLVRHLILLSFLLLLVFLSKHLFYSLHLIFLWAIYLKFLFFLFVLFPIVFSILKFLLFFQHLNLFDQDYFLSLFLCLLSFTILRSLSIAYFSTSLFFPLLWKLGWLCSSLSLAK